MLSAFTGTGFGRSSTGPIFSGITLFLDAANTDSYPGSGSNWTDLAGTKQNISLINSPTFTSGSAAYFTFNGSTQYGTGSTAGVVPSSGYTKSAWFYLNSTSADNNLISSASSNHFMFFMGSNRMYCGHANWAGFPSNFPSVATFSTGARYNTVCTFTTTDGMKLYINGQLDSTYTAIKTGHGGNGATNIATFGGGNFLNGRLSLVQCYNRALTANEIKRNFQFYRSRFSL